MEVLEVITQHFESSQELSDGTRKSLQLKIKTKQSIIKSN